MAKQNGIYKLSGSLDNSIFVHSVYGHHVRKKAVINKDRFYGPSYERQFCILSEYARATKAGKLLRDAIRSVLHQMKNRNSSNNLNKAFYQVILSDKLSERGARNVINGDITLLKGFDFNEEALLRDVFSVDYTIQRDTDKGTVSVKIPSFKARTNLKVPAECTHYEIVSMTVALDFVMGTTETFHAQTGHIELTAAPTKPTELTNPLPVNIEGPTLLILGIKFYQLVNGTAHHIRNQNTNALKIMELWL
jgi:hypothetical protein